MVEYDNFVECINVAEANNVDLTKYTFVGLKHDTYVFKIRVKF